MQIYLIENKITYQNDREYNVSFHIAIPGNMKIFWHMQLNINHEYRQFYE